MVSKMHVDIRSLIGSCHVSLKEIDLKRLNDARQHGASSACKTHKITGLLSRNDAIIL